MIVVRVCTDGLTVEGHADHAEAGKDIVCASVSALTQSLVYGLESLTEDEIRYRLEPGNSEVRYENLSEQGCLLVDSFFIGISTMAMAYPEYVKVI